jgi:hypothetical protein
MTLTSRDETFDRLQHNPEFLCLQAIGERQRGMNSTATAANAKTIRPPLIFKKALSCAESKPGSPFREGTPLTASSVSRREENNVEKLIFFKAAV